MNEGVWESAVKNLDAAMRIHRSNPEYNYALAKCYMEMGKIKDAVIYFSAFIKARPKSLKGWKELLRCLYNAKYYEEALEQVNNATRLTENKPLLLFYKSAILFALGKSKEALLQLEMGLQKSPKLLKQLIELNPSLLQSQQVVDLVSRYKGRRNKG
jgi:tetratricopeptide (TPR) repeat protein